MGKHVGAGGGYKPSPGFHSNSSPTSRLDPLAPERPDLPRTWCWGVGVDLGLTLK